MALLRIEGDSFDSNAIRSNQTRFVRNECNSFETNAIHLKRMQFVWNEHNSFETNAIRLNQNDGARFDSITERGQLATLLSNPNWQGPARRGSTALRVGRHSHPSGCVPTRGRRPDAVQRESMALRVGRHSRPSGQVLARPDVRHARPERSWMEVVDKRVRRTRAWVSIYVMWPYNTYFARRSRFVY